MTFLRRDVIFFNIHLSPSIETVDQSEKFRNSQISWEQLSSVGSIIVRVQSNKALALHIK